MAERAEEGLAVAKVAQVDMVGRLEAAASTPLLELVGEVGTKEVALQGALKGREAVLAAALAMGEALAAVATVVEPVEKEESMEGPKATVLRAVPTAAVAKVGLLVAGQVVVVRAELLALEGSIRRSGLAGEAE